jgi:hypothetical protein
MWIALIAAAASLVVAVLTYLLSGLREKHEAARETTLRYINPLRFYACENLFRLLEIGLRVEENHQCDALLYVSRAEELSSQPRDWFNRQGAYLATSCYLTARLFACLADVRRELPYFRLRTGRDTDLLAVLRAVNVAFTKDLGIFYVTQDSIGADVSDEQRRLSYREFCELLMDEDRRVWFDRLIAFYLDLGAGGHQERLTGVVKSLLRLTRFLDEAVHGGQSLNALLESEERDSTELRRTIAELDAGAR